jgi:hypothetical protein
MTIAIDLLEKMGRNAQLRHAGNTAIAEMLTNENIPRELQNAILDGDESQLEALLGGSQNLCCVLGAVEESDAGYSTAALERS